MRMTTDIPVLLPWWCVSGSRFLEPHREPAALSAESLQHRPCLLELPEQAVDILNRGAAAPGDAPAAAAPRGFRLPSPPPRPPLGDCPPAGPPLAAHARPPTARPPPPP